MEVGGTISSCCDLCLPGSWHLNRLLYLSVLQGLMIHLSQCDGMTKDAFVHPSWMHFEATGGLHVLTFTGTVIIDLEAGGREMDPELTGGWKYEDLQIDLALPTAVVPAGKTFHLERCAPFLTVNAVGGVSTVGWAVNEFSGPSKTAVHESIPIQASIAVFRTGEVLHRIGYHVSVTGRLEESA